MRRPGRGAGGARSTPSGASRPLSRRGAGWAKAVRPEQIRLFSRFVPAADAPSQTQSIPSAAPAALCVALCCQNAGRGRDGGAHPVHDPWSERVHPMQGNLPRNPKESERRMVKQPQSSPWAGDKVWPHPQTGITARLQRRCSDQDSNGWTRGLKPQSRKSFRLRVRKVSTPQLRSAGTAPDCAGRAR